MLDLRIVTSADFLCSHADRGLLPSKVGAQELSWTSLFEARFVRIQGAEVSLKRNYFLTAKAGSLFCGPYVFKITTLS